MPPSTKEVRLRCGVAPELWLLIYTGDDGSDNRAGSVRVRWTCTIQAIWKEVIAVELQKWETPEFEEIGTSAEVTAYAGIWPDSE
jgi:coenzyme PQQ precursor peptide PqqA